MKRIIILLALVALLIPAFAHAETPPAAADFEQMLTGEWTLRNAEGATGLRQYDHISYAPGSDEFFLFYSADGRVYLVACSDHVIRSLCGELTFTADGENMMILSDHGTFFYVKE